jgi:hypothetical protein
MKVMERVYQDLQMTGVKASEHFNDLCRQKVQLEEQLQDVNDQIQYTRGVLDTVGEAQGQIAKWQKIDADKRKYEEGMKNSLTGSGDVR